LELLVVWRGTPGWFAKGGKSGSQGSGSGSTWSHRFSDGGYSFELSGNTNARTADVLGKTYDLTKSNAILIDGVDSPDGPRIAGTLMFDPRLPNGSDPNQRLMLIGRSKELRDYLRCDTVLPDPSMQARLAPLCALILSQ
jgi:hypothetical protein